MDKPTLFALYCLSGCLLPAGIQAETAEQPELEMLEFLAEWQMDQGAWIDPLQMQDMAEIEHHEESIEVSGDE